VHAFARLGRERHHGPAAVGRVLAADDEPSLLEVADQLARRRQAETDCLGELAHAALALDADLREQADVPAPEPRFALARRHEAERRSAPTPEPAQHVAQRLAGEGDLLFCYH